jgi:hypothetical protein
MQTPGVNFLTDMVLVRPKQVGAVYLLRREEMKTMTMIPYPYLLTALVNKGLVEKASMLADRYQIERVSAPTGRREEMRALHEKMNENRRAKGIEERPALKSPLVYGSIPVSLSIPSNNKTVTRV